MSEPAAPSVTDDDYTLAEMLVEYEDAVAVGRPVSPEHVCRDRPDLLAPFVELLKQVGQFADIIDGPPPTPHELVGRIRAGRFVPTAFHAAGGLGLVYEADDRELGRRVALKWMQPHMARHPDARRRFRAEAEITGHLEHPGVAPVYGSGDDPDGRPYYAMRFIRGDTLFDALRRHHAAPDSPAKRVEFARLLRSFASVCQTVAYAHARGVIHRDLKPGNVMLGPYGETLVVDWGLARQVRSADGGTSPPRPPSPAGEGGVQPAHAPDLPRHEGARAPAGKSDETRPYLASDAAIPTLHSADGQTVAGVGKGTPGYMPPEQARGEWDKVGPAADVYALGATLFALLTNQTPPASGADVLKANPAAPKPLAAVCAKAMATDSADRYASAQDLAADVDRWLTDEPVSAYRDPLPTRARRWVKRHRTLVSVAAAAVLVAGLALAVVAPILTAQNAALAKANGDLGNANSDLGKANGDLTDANTKLADANVKVADAAAAAGEDYEKADQALMRVAAVALARLAEGKSEQALIAQRAVLVRYRTYQTDFIARNAARPERRFEAAAAWLKVWEIEYALGRLKEAADAADAAEKLFAGLKAERPDDRDVEYGWAAARQQQGTVRGDLGKLTAALPPLLDARDTFRRLAKDPAPLRIARLNSVGTDTHQDSPSFRLASTLVVLTQVQAQVGRLARASGMPTAGDTADQREGLRAALTALTGDKPLPPETALTTRITAFDLRRRIAQSDPDPEEMKRLLAGVLADVKVVALVYPTAGELLAVGLECEGAIGQIDVARARELWRAARAATRAARPDALQLWDEWEKAMQTAYLGMAEVEADAAVLEQADLGLDLSDVRASALAVRGEIGAALLPALAELGERDKIARLAPVTLDALKRLVASKPLPPEAATRGALAALQLGGAAHLVARSDPGMIETCQASVLSTPVVFLHHTGRAEKLLKLEAEAVEVAQALNDRLVQFSPDEPAYRRMRAYLRVARVEKVTMRGGDPDPVFAQAEKDIADLADGPDDGYKLFVQMLLLNARAEYAAERKKDYPAALDLLAATLGKLDEVKEAGFPPTGVDVFRVMFHTSTADVLRRQAEATTDKPKARALIARAQQVLEECEKQVIRDDPDPDIRQRIEFVRDRQQGVREAVDNLAAKLQK